MRYLVVSLLVMAMVTFIYWSLRKNSSDSAPVGSVSQAGASAGLADEAIKAIIDEQRRTRTDLPEPFPEFDWVVRHQGDHYTYMEYGIPKAPGYNQIFKLNRQGVIVDVQFYGDPSKSIDCPGKTLSESELATIVEQERAIRDDLPVRFPNFRTRVDRLRCLYMYFEYALPEVPGKHHVFVIDPFGELMEVFRSRPYPQ